MSGTIETVGIYLTEDERRLLTSLVGDLKVREESALRRSEGPEAQAYAATSEALCKLMFLPADKAVSADRLRSAVGHAIMNGLVHRYVVIDGQHQTHGDIGKIADAIAIAVAAQLTGAAP